MASPLDSTMGAWLVSLFLATILYGMGFIQTYLYFHWYTKDHWGVKAVVICLLICETLHITLYFCATYGALIDHFGDFDALFVITWPDVVSNMGSKLQLACFDTAEGSTNCRGMSSTTYFAHGIYAFLILTSYSFKTIFALLQIAQTVIVAELGSFTLLNQTKRITTLQAASALVCDVLITACLCYTLNGQKSTIKSTNSILDTLKINAVNRGMLTAFAAALNIILFISIPNSFWFSLALIPSGKLYMNSMLATLNTREHIRQRIQHDSVGCNSISLGSLSSNASAGPTNPQNPANTTIDISSLNGYKSHDEEKKHTFAANMRGELERPLLKPVTTNSRSSEPNGERTALNSSGKESQFPLVHFTGNPLEGVDIVNARTPGRGDNSGCNACCGTLFVLEKGLERASGVDRQVNIKVETKQGGRAGSPAGYFSDLTLCTGYRCLTPPSVSSPTPTALLTRYNVPQSRRCGASLRPAATLATVRPGVDLLPYIMISLLRFTLIGVTGVIMSQFFTYWNSRYQDPWWIKTLVAFLFIVNITQAAAVVYMSWFYCVTNFANPGVVASKNSLPGEKPHLNPFIQSLYGRIPSHISQRPSLQLQIRCSNRGGYICSPEAEFASVSWWWRLWRPVEWALPLQLRRGSFPSAYLPSGTTVAGTNVTATPQTSQARRAPANRRGPTYSSVRHRRDPCRTDKVLNRLIRTAVQSGFFTGGWSGTLNEPYDGLNVQGILAVFALGTLFSFRFSPGTYMIALFTFPIGRIYTHTMMDHFISREPLRNNLSNSGNILTVPNFGAAGEESSGAANGTVILLRNVSTRTNTTKTNETV
ncbi:hypothetical protein B0H14DRAFT_2618607 [Mycena olivaceomarginata]|nr:hypothetical protein B0H14DRAFT_2618607 [Mycena olivaceomarginata]